MCVAFFALVTEPADKGFFFSILSSVTSFPLCAGERPVAAIGGVPARGRVAPAIGRHLCALKKYPKKKKLITFT